MKPFPMKLTIFPAFLILSTSLSAQATLKLQCDEFTVTIDSNSLSVEGAIYDKDSDSTLGFNTGKSRHMTYRDATNPDKKHNWFAIDILTTNSGKKTYLLSNNVHLNERAITCGKD